MFIETTVWICDYCYDGTLHDVRQERPQVWASNSLTCSSCATRCALIAPWRRSWADGKVRAIGVSNFMHLQRGRSVIPTSVQPARLAANVDVFDFDFTSGELDAIDALDTGGARWSRTGGLSLEAIGRSSPRSERREPMRRRPLFIAPLVRLNHLDLRQRCPRYPDFLALRAEYDPGNKFAITALPQRVSLPR